MKENPLRAAILTCLLPFGNTALAIEACQPVYNPEQETLDIPCVQVGTAEKTMASYNVQLKHHDGRLSAQSIQPTEIASESSCVASYNLDDNSMYVPCISVKGDTNPNNSFEIALSNISTDEGNIQFSLTDLGNFATNLPEENESTRRKIGDAYNGKWNVPHVYQRNYPNIKGSACGPSSVAMLLKFYYPNSNIDMPEIYHGGTQDYTYHGDAIGYRNIGLNRDAGDTKFDKVAQKYRSSFSASFTGMNITSMQNYLTSIWGIFTNPPTTSPPYAKFEPTFTTFAKMKEYIAQGPLLTNVYWRGDKRYGHYIVVTGVDKNYVYISDPDYPNYPNNTDSKYNRVPVSEFQTKWFKGRGLLLRPQETRAQAEYTVVVDSGNNMFDGTFDGTNTVNKFQLDTDYKGATGWKFYYGGGGDWYYPTEAGHAARWTPKLMKSGYYQVSTKFRGDKDNGNVTYAVYSKDGKIIAGPIKINQYRSPAKWDYGIVASEVYLQDGAYVRAYDIPVGSNVDAIKFKFVR